MKILFALLACLAAVWPLAPRAASAEEAATYARIINENVYFYAQADADSGLFVLPRTYFVRITGGRLAAAGVHCSFSGLAPELAFKATAEGGTVVCAGFEFPEMNAQLKTALDKGLTITAVTDESAGSAAAINLLVNKAVNTQPFGIAEISAADAGKLFAAQSESTEKSGRAHYGIVNML